MGSDRIISKTNPDLSRNASQSAHYDKVTIGFHWLTAVLVITLFALAEGWGFLPRGTWLRKGFQSLHISLGILLTLVLVGRLVWRFTEGRHLPPVGPRVMAFAAKAVHHALYLLLVAQVVLGYLFRWAQGEPFMFFGLFSVPPLFAPDEALAHTFGSLHDYGGWTIIILASLHAVAALAHHYALGDAVLRRMLPIAR